ncbi:MAG: extracellular solute-binding protein [Paenibacillaceae bacterium]|jgi:putative aldouronate transport system substrate-binding protein|nr:extracellular solute-binding protein [Paenibacillaceae bacterium]
MMVMTPGCRLGWRLACLVVLASLAACEGAPAGPENKPLPAGLPELIYYYPADAQRDQQLIQAELNRYTGEKIGATVSLRPIAWASVQEKTNLLLSSGERFDIIFAPSWLHYANYAPKGVFAELDPLIDRFAPQLRTELHPAFLAGPRLDGRLYAIPTNKEAASQYAFIFNRRLVDKYGMDVSRIARLADLEPFLQIIKENEPTVQPLFMLADSNAKFYDEDSLEPIGPADIPGKLDTSAMTVVNEYTLPSMLDKFRLVRRWFEAGYINRDAATSQSDYRQMMQSGSAWIILGASGKPGAAAEWTAMTGGIPMVQVNWKSPLISTESATNSMLAISARSRYPGKAMQFINLLHTDAYVNNLLNFGMEGLHYRQAPDGTIEAVPDGGYKPAIAWTVGNQFLNYLASGEAADKWEQYRQFNRQAAVSKVMGFSFDPSPVSREIAAVSNISRQYHGILNTGSVRDVEGTVEGMLAKYRLAGVDAIIAEKQRQLDVFLAGRGMQHEGRSPLEQ